MKEEIIDLSDKQDVDWTDEGLKDKTVRVREDQIIGAQDAVEDVKWDNLVVDDHANDEEVLKMMYFQNPALAFAEKGMVKDGERVLETIMFPGTNTVAYQAVLIKNGENIQLGHKVAKPLEHGFAEMVQEAKDYYKNAFEEAESLRAAQRAAGQVPKSIDEMVPVQSKHIVPPWIRNHILFETPDISVEEYDNIIWTNFRDLWVAEHKPHKRIII